MIVVVVDWDGSQHDFLIIFLKLFLVQKAYDYV